MCFITMILWKQKHSTYFFLSHEKALKMSFVHINDKLKLIKYNYFSKKSYHLIFKKFINQIIDFYEY